MAWKEIRLPIAEVLAETWTPLLDREQRGYLSSAWPAVWLEADWTEDAWRRALGFTPTSWELQREDYAAVLQRDDGSWALPFMLRERARQKAESEKQSTKASRRWMPNDAAASRGMPQHAAASSGMQEHAGASPASASASESEPSRSRNGSGREREIRYTIEFEAFWDQYRCIRRTGKPAAFREWTVAGGARISQQIMDALDAYQKTAQWRDGFMPEPARWLKKRPWEDGPVPAEDPAW